MQLLNDGQYIGAFSIMQYGAAGYMYLSNAVLQALDIFAVGSEFGKFILLCARNIVIVNKKKCLFM